MISPALLRNVSAVTKGTSKEIKEAPEWL